MTQELKLTILGIPVAKGRPRMISRGHVYTPAKTAEYENRVAEVALKSKVRFEKDVPLEMEVSFVYPKPKKLPKNRSNYFVTPKPDMSNLIKAIEDGMEKGRIYHDDAQIVTVIALKRYGDPPRTEVTLRIAEEVER